MELKQVGQTKKERPPLTEEVGDPRGSQRASDSPDTTEQNGLGEGKSGELMGNLCGEGEQRAR